MLSAWLDWHRATLAVKCDGLSADQLRELSTPPSTLSLLGLVRHMADVERGWFRQVLHGEDVPDVYPRAQDPDADFSDVAAADVGQAFAAWEAECELARAAVAGAESLEIMSSGLTGRGNRVSLRWILVHMIEEYARHNGHADLLRERIDGVTGD
jgi:uncharacterized damage-inducible protein DinB